MTDVAACAFDGVVNPISFSRPHNTPGIFEAPSRFSRTRVTRSKAALWLRDPVIEDLVDRSRMRCQMDIPGDVHVSSQTSTPANELIRTSRCSISQRNRAPGMRRAYTDERACEQTAIERSNYVILKKSCRSMLRTSGEQSSRCTATPGEAPTSNRGG